jgi:cell volume regulation protein A
VFLVNRLRLGYEGLYPVLTLSLVLFTYVITDFAGGNGFLAVYLAGIIAGNLDFIHKRSLLHFHDGLAWLMQITMFLTLGLLVVLCYSFCERNNEISSIPNDVFSPGPRDQK